MTVRRGWPPGSHPYQPRLLDLFCCAGGAARGYADAGFEVVGVDIDPQPHYPFEFIHADAVEFMERMVAGGTWEWKSLATFDAIHASPPCQRYSDLAKRNGNAEDWPDLIEPIRDLLVAAGKPYIIENVEGAPLLDPVTLCGTMFPARWVPCDKGRACDRCHGAGEYPTGAGYTREWLPCMEKVGKGLRVLRHRLFETNWPLVPPLEHPRHPLVFTHDKRKAHYGLLDQDTSFVQVTGGGNCTVANKADALGIDWMTGHELNEAIPPAYTKFIGGQLFAMLTHGFDCFRGRVCTTHVTFVPHPQQVAGASDCASDGAA